MGIQSIHFCASGNYRISDCEIRTVLVDFKYWSLAVKKILIITCHNGYTRLFVVGSLLACHQYSDLSEVGGKFSKFSGKVIMSEDDFTNAQIEGTVNIESIDTDNERRDGH